MSKYYRQFFLEIQRCRSESKLKTYAENTTDSASLSRLSIIEARNTITTHWKSIGAFQLSIKLIEIDGYVTQSVLERLCGKRENGVEVLENIFYFSLFFTQKLHHAIIIIFFLEI